MPAMLLSLVAQAAGRAPMNPHNPELYWTHYRAGAWLWWAIIAAIVVAFVAWAVTGRREHRPPPTLP